MSIPHQHFEYLGDPQERAAALAMLRAAAGAIPLTELEDGRVQAAIDEAKTARMLQHMRSWRRWVSPEEQQATVNQLAGAMWAASMLMGVLLGAVFLIGFPLSAGQAVPWVAAACFLPALGLGVMATISVITPVRPQWRRALAGIRLRKFS